MQLSKENPGYAHAMRTPLTCSHIEMPFAPYDKAVLDAHCLCGILASCSVFSGMLVLTLVLCARLSWPLTSF